MPDNPFNESNEYHYNNGPRYRDWLIEIKTKLSTVMETQADQEQRLRKVERFMTAVLAQAALISLILSGVIGVFFTWLSDKIK